MSAEGLKLHQDRWGACLTIMTPAELAGHKCGPVYNLNVELIFPNKNQPRLPNFNPAKMARLRKSIERNGIMEPVKVRIQGAGAGMHTQLVGGERRWRTVKALFYKTMPAIVRPPFDSEEDFDIESLNEGDLHDDYGPLEKAVYYQGLIEKYGLTQGQLADKIHRDISHVCNHLQYIKLIRPLQKALQEGRIPLGVAKEIASFQTDRQLMANDLLEAEAKKKGRPLKQFEVGLVLRRMAQKLKVKRNIITPLKKGRIPYESGAFMANKTSSLTRQLVEVLKEISAAPKEEIEKSGGAFLTAMDELNVLLPLAEKVWKKLKKEV